MGEIHQGCIVYLQQMQSTRIAVTLTVASLRWPILRSEREQRGRQSEATLTGPLRFVARGKLLKRFAARGKYGRL